MFLNKAAVSGILISLLCVSASAGAAMPATAPTAAPVDLKLDTNVYTLHTQTVNFQPVTYRAYENLVYVAHPVDAQYEKMNLYVPEAYYQGHSSHGYTANC